MNLSDRLRDKLYHWKFSSADAILVIDPSLMDDEAARAGVSAASCCFGDNQWFPGAMGTVVGLLAEYLMSKVIEKDC